MIDKLKVPEFDEWIELESKFSDGNFSGYNQTAGTHCYFGNNRFVKADLLTKEIEKRNRVIEKLIEQRNEFVPNHLINAVTGRSLKICLDLELESLMGDEVKEAEREKIYEFLRNENKGHEAENEKLRARIARLEGLIIRLGNKLGIEGNAIEYIEEKALTEKESK